MSDPPLGQAGGETLDLRGGQPLPADLPRLEKYRVEQLLGRGGFGAVYLARDLALDRPVALKLLHRADPADLARLRREARLMARLELPGVVRVYEQGEAEGRAYVAMQYLPGGNLLEARLEREALLRVAAATARTLARVHAEGVVHRDLKPENILLDEDGAPWVTDFGVARDLRRRGSGSEGFVIGTPEMMAPEQARGQTARIDARTDVYGLGATLYMLLTGRRPFRRASLVETLHAVIHESPALPRALDPSLPRPLQALVLRCLCKDPAERFASMDALAEALEELLRGEPRDPDASGGGWLALPAPQGLPEPGALVDAAQHLADWDARWPRRSRGLPGAAAPLRALREQLDQVLRERPDRAWPRLLRGMTLRRLGDLAGAVDDLERAADRLQDQPLAQEELGALYLEAARLELADPERVQGFVADEDHQAVVEGYLDLALVAWEEAAALGRVTPVRVQAFLAAARLLAGGEAEACASACAGACAEEPDAEELWWLWGEALRRGGGDPAPAWRESLQVCRSQWDLALALAERLGPEEEGRRWLERALALQPALVPAWLLRARWALPAGAGPAAEALERARAAAPSPERESRPEDRRARELSWVERTLALLPEGDEVRAARGALRRARQALREEDDPRPDLDALLALCDPAGAFGPAAQDWLLRLAGPPPGGA